MKLVILDRDGVINEDSDDYIKSPDEWHAIPGSLGAIARLNQAGYQVIVVTNQSGIGRGYYDYDTLQAIHDKMHQQLAIIGGQVDAIFFCPHIPEDQCECRKPKPGLLKEVQERLSVDLQKVYAVGDSLRDLQAAQTVGAMPILVRTGKGERTVARGEGLAGIPVFDNLATFVDALLVGEERA